jgi:hypothetical protein
MVDSVQISILANLSVNQAADVLAETNRGLTGLEIIRALGAYRRPGACDESVRSPFGKCHRATAGAETCYFSITDAKELVPS